MPDKFIRYGDLFRPMILDMIEQETDPDAREDLIRIGMDEGLINRQDVEDIEQGELPL